MVFTVTTLHQPTLATCVMTIGCCAVYMCTFYLAQTSWAELIQLDTSVPQTTFKAFPSLLARESAEQRAQFIVIELISYNILAGEMFYNIEMTLYPIFYFILCVVALSENKGQSDSHHPPAA